MKSYVVYYMETSEALFCSHFLAGDAFIPSYSSFSGSRHGHSGAEQLIQSSGKEFRSQASCKSGRFARNLFPVRHRTFKRENCVKTAALSFKGPLPNPFETRLGQFLPL